MVYGVYEVYGCMSGKHTEEESTYSCSMDDGCWVFLLAAEAIRSQAAHPLLDRSSFPQSDNCLYLSLSFPMRQ
jgi:hypothetical protein